MELFWRLSESRQVRPKMGKLELDYNKLHDAFFRWQTKPPMKGHGDLYYEGKVRMSGAWDV